MDATTALGVLVTLLLLAVMKASMHLRAFGGDQARRKAFYSFPGYTLATPILGDLPRLTKPGVPVLRTGLGIVQKFGGRFRFWLMHYPAVVLSDPDDVEVIVSNSNYNNKAPMAYSIAEAFFGAGLVTINGELWRRHRKHITHAFHFRILEEYVSVFKRKAKNLVDKLAPQADGVTSFDVFPEFGAVANETIFETAFGFDETTNLSVGTKMDRREFVDLMEFSFYALQKRLLQPWLLPDVVFNLTPNGRRFRKGDAMINDFATAVIRERQAKLSRGAPAGRNFVDLMMTPADDGSLLNEAEIRGELRTFMSVQQTSASIMAFTMMTLALHPNEQHRVLEEILDELGDESNSVSYDQLMGLKHLERVIKETMRLYPVVPAIGRDVLDDTRIKGGVIPAGTIAVVGIMPMHRNPKVWDDPMRFDPDRFLPDRCVGRHPFAYLPFSAGPRNCIGQKYAMIQMKAVLSALIRHYEILPGEHCTSMGDLERNMDAAIFLVMTKGCNVRLRPRGRATQQLDARIA